jgi:hypothetical protein
MMSRQEGRGLWTLPVQSYARSFWALLREVVIGRFTRTFLSARSLSGKLPHSGGWAVLVVVGRSVVLVLVSVRWFSLLLMFAVLNGSGVFGIVRMIAGSRV